MRELRILDRRSFLSLAVGDSEVEAPGGIRLFLLPAVFSQRARDRSSSAFLLARIDSILDFLSLGLLSLGLGPGAPPLGGIRLALRDPGVPSGFIARGEGGGKRLRVLLSSALLFDFSIPLAGVPVPPSAASAPNSACSLPPEPFFIAGSRTSHCQAFF